MTTVKSKIWFRNCQPFDRPLVDVDNIVYPTVNHFYYAHKTTNLMQRWHVANQATSDMAIRASKLFEVRADWQQIHTTIMRTALNFKFAPKTSWALRLRMSSEELVNWNNDHDTYWGCCKCPKCASMGHNMLGILLMNIRSCLLNKEQNTKLQQHRSCS